MHAPAAAAPVVALRKAILCQLEHMFQVQRLNRECASGHSQHRRVRSKVACEERCVDGGRHADNFRHRCMGTSISGLRDDISKEDKEEITQHLPLVHFVNDNVAEAADAVSIVAADD
eukprot:6194839-Pleurochrysis_carterae.AAC.7